MNKKLLMIVGGVLVITLLVGGIGAYAVYAQSATPTTPSGWQGGPGGHRGQHPLGQAELDAAAKALGMTSADLSTELQSGKTLPQLATEKGVDIKTVMQAIQAARPVMLGPAELTAAAQALNMTTTDLSTQLKSGKTLAELATQQNVPLQTVETAIQTARNAQIQAQINQAVTDGKMTQDKANWLLEGLNKGYLNGPGLGFGFGRGGLRGQPGQQPVQPAQPTNP